MATSKTSGVKRGISALWDTLQCPICLDLMAAPVSTKCDHQFCKFCILKLLDSSKQNKATCPVCKAKITKRSLQESPGFQRLVTGLQDMIQSYERDTGTNFFAGSLPQERHLNTDAEAPKELLNGSPASMTGTDIEKGEDLDGMDLPESHTSTLAAQNGYAQLIQFEDVHCTATEGLDSGLGDGPPASDGKVYNSAESAEAVQAAKSDNEDESNLQRQGKRTSEESNCVLPNSEETEDRIFKKSSKRKRKKKPEEILEQRKKKSLEKVTEWLMKVPPHGSPELEDMEKDAEDSDSCSSTSTIDIHQHNFDFNLRKEDKAKALEEQVFGAVYKRERRSNKASAGPHNSLVKPSSNSEAKTGISEINTENGLLLDDLEQRSEGSMELEHEMEDREDANIDFFKVGKPKELQGESFVGASMDDVQNVDKNESVSIGSCSLLDKDEEKSAAKPKRNTHSSRQQVDSDLKEQVNKQSSVTAEKKNNRRTTRARAANPLVLVGVENGASSPKNRGRSRELQVLIESYPSSEDLEVPLRSTRRSKRLPDVHLVQKKENTRGPRKAGNQETIPPNNECETSDGTTSLEKVSSVKLKARNGCVYDQDLGGIENMELDERPPCTMAAGDVAENLNVESVRPPCPGVASVVPNSISPTQKDVLGPEPTPENTQPPDHPLNNSQSEASVCEADCEEMEDQEEFDTEQLLKSFKATKRKSFLLHSPDMPAAPISASDNVIRGADVEKQHQDGMDVGSFEPTPQNAPRDSVHSPQRDLIRLSVSPAPSTKRTRRSPDGVAVPTVPDVSCSAQSRVTDNQNIRSSSSSALTPNQVSKLEGDSLRPSGIPQGVDSDFQFSTAGPKIDHRSLGYSEAQEGEPGCSSEDVLQTKEGRDNSQGHLDGNWFSVNRTDDRLVAGSSLTPDGLTAPAVQTEPNNNPSGESSALSSLKSNPRRRRRARRLESSSGSDGSQSNDDLPTLAQIFGIPPAAPQDQDVPSKAKRREVVGGEAERPPSPDCISPSQASVDLFGTPEEVGEGPVINTEVSMESSQFSSEVLVTQQKVEMQKELVRLEKLMALVSEVLHEKEGSPIKDILTDSKQDSRAAGDKGGSNHRSPVGNRDAGPDCSRKAGAGAEQDLNATTSDGRGTTEACVTKSGTSKDTAAQPSSHTGLSFKAPAHSRAHNSSPSTKTVKNCSKGQEDKENDSPPKDKLKSKLLLVSSGLGPSEQLMVKKFAKRVGARVVSQVTPEVTHVIMRTDEQLVCERTLKYFLGIAGRKWVVSFQWVSECFKQQKLLDESPFEVRGDVVNGVNHQGPSRARTTDDSDLLMKGFKICFQGPFTDMSTDEMEWMVELCGATVVKDPLHFDVKQKLNQLLIVQPRSGFPSSTSSNLSKHATVLTRGWLLDTVATYTLQNYDIYTT